MPKGAEAFLRFQSCATCVKLTPCTKRRDHWGMLCKDFERSDRFNDAVSNYAIEAVFTELGE